MKYSELLKKFNLGLIVRKGKVTEEGDRSQDRKDMLASLTGTFDFKNEGSVGIKPVTEIADGYIRISWEVSTVRDRNGSLMRIPFEHMTRSEIDCVYKVRGILEDIETQDMNMDSVLDENGFRVYTREDIA